MDMEENPKAETESEIIAAHNQALKIKYHASKILQRETHSKCQQYDETIDHIISACAILAKEQYIKRHDREYAQLHFNVSKETGVKLEEEHWYEHISKTVETSNGTCCGINK
jgi:hypothetical protein